MATKDKDAFNWGYDPVLFGAPRPKPFFAQGFGLEVSKEAPSLGDENPKQ